MKRVRIHSANSDKESCGAFTVVELLVVIVTVALLAAVLLPVLAASHPDSQAFQCLNNMIQLQLASILYAADNGDYLPGNEGSAVGPDGLIGVSQQDADWVAGDFSSVGYGGNGANDYPAGAGTNAALLGVYGNVVPGLPAPLYGSIGGYTKNPKLYVCPAVHFIDPYYRQPRVRTCSVNCYVGTTPSQQKLAVWISPNYTVFSKYSDFVKLKSSDAIVFVDESLLTINDGFFLVPEPSGGNDQPAVNHGPATSFSFADGHAALHAWHDYFLGKTGNNTDEPWLDAHITVHK